MGNNNVTGQQVSDEAAYRIDKTIEPSNGAPRLNSTDSETNNEKDGTEDVNLSKSLKGLIITNAEDKKVASYQNISSDTIEGLDEKKRGSIEDNTSTTQEDDQSSYLPKDGESLRKEAFETTVFSTEIVALVGNTNKDVTSNKDSSVSCEKMKQLMHGTREDTSEENIESNYKSLLQENTEDPVEDQEETSSHENASMGGNIDGEDTTEILEKGYIEVPKVEVEMQKDTTSSVESNVSTYLDADDSEIKEVVVEDKPGQRDSPPDEQALYGINLETDKNDNIEAEMAHDMEEISAISKTATVNIMVEIDEALEDDKHIHELGNQYENIIECTSCDNLCNNEVLAKCQSSSRNPIAINDRELGNELNERVVASRQISGSVTAKVEHTGIETLHKDEGILEKIVSVWNLEDKFAVKNETEEYDGDLINIAEVNANDHTGLHSSSLDHLVVNEVEVQRKINGVNVKVEFEEILEEGDKVNTAEGLGIHVDSDGSHVVAKEGGDSSNLLMTTPSTPLQVLENIEKEVSITRDTQEIMTNSQDDQPQQILLEEYEVVKLENGEILSNCMQLVGNSLNGDMISADGISHEKADPNTRASYFTFEANQKVVTVTASTAATGFTTECNQAKATASVDMATKEQRPLQTSTSGREAGEETPLLQEVKNIEKHNQVDVEIPVADIAITQFNAEVEEESEKSPLLTPRETSGDFRIKNHSATNQKPFQTLLTEGGVGMWSPLEEPESNPKRTITTSSPRSKEKQRPRSSLFTSCMCCATATN
nr:unnamed protein product [Digitaria exilis]